MRQVTDEYRDTKIDCSFSGIVSAIQDDRIKGIEMLTELAQTIESGEKKAIEIDWQLKQLNGDIEHFKMGVKNIIKHLKIDFPIVLVSNGKAYTISRECRIEAMNILK